MERAGFLFPVLVVVAGAGAEVDPWVLSSARLPCDYSSCKFMPSLGNGQLAMRPQLPAEPADSDPPSILVNCLYSGAGPTSHRARLPGLANYRAGLAGPGLVTNYSLDLRRGEFRSSLQQDGLRVEQTQLVHQVYTRTILSLLEASQAGGEETAELEVRLEAGPESEDLLELETGQLAVPPNTLGLTSLLYWCGQAKVPEYPEYEPEPGRVCVAWSPAISLSVPPSGASSLLLLTLVDSSLAGLQAELELVAALPSPAHLLQSHHAAWQEVWQAGSVTVEDELGQLGPALLASQFYLLSSLPSQHSARTLPAYCGLSPAGLPHGLEGRDYQGHRHVLLTR